MPQYNYAPSNYPAQQPYQYQGITPPPAQPMGAVQQPYQYQSVATQPEPMAQNIYAPPNYPAQSSNAAQSANAFNKKKGKKKLIIALAIAIPIVLICGVIAGLLIYKHLNTNTVGNTSGNIANGGLAAQQTVEVTFRPADSYKATRSEIDMTVSILKKRLRDMNITNSNIKVDYNVDSITVRFVPHGGITDANTEVAQLGSAAKLVFKSPEYNGGADIITGKDVKSASVETDSSNVNAYVVNITLNSSGISKFDAATKALAVLQAADSTKGQLYIYLDTVKVEQAGVLNEISDGNTEISGGFTAASAKALADTINAGVMPFALETGSISFPD
jgi:preprotein translocase subunit SecD